MRFPSSIGLGVLCGSLLAPLPAQAFSTRVHIMIANKVREAMIEAGDGSIPLRMGEYSVQLPQPDFEAIRDNPLAFRAGAVGPDNMVFPGMTDPSHALGQRPYQQCELLYEAAVTGEERAYSLGCFLHGATDAVAHHYVNYLAGETFTLTPISNAREQDLDNVVRHILAESAIQDAAFELDPGAFSTGSLLHTIPIGLVLRTYLDQDAALWQMMAASAKAEYDAARAENPDASLPALVASMDIAPADHLVLTPIYLAEVDGAIDDTRADLEARILDMQDHASADGSKLLVIAGDDGELGTKDDETDCSATCPTLYATYFTYTGLLAPRYNAQNQELPSAFEKLTEELRAELMGFHPAYMESVGNFSAKLNEPLDGMPSGFGIEKSEVQLIFQPMTDWADDISTIDYDTLLYAVLPDWIIELDTAMQVVGVDIDLAGIVQAIFQPIIAPIKDAIEQAFIGQAEMFIGELIDEIDAQEQAVNAEYDGVLAGAAHPELEGDVLDHFYDSGLFAHAFNITAATLANHAAILPVGDDSVGPASFDASYTPAWMQAGVCDYLAEAVFPLGLEAQGAMSVREGADDYPAMLDDDSPVECHDGSLSMFTSAPSALNCTITRLTQLLADPRGSLSRAYPPEFSMLPANCEDTVIPGLPEPPDDGGTDDGGDGTGDGTGDDTGSGGDAGSNSEDGGCGCAAAPSPARGLPVSILAIVGLGLVRRRRRAALGLVGALAMTACGGGGGDGDGSGSDAETGSETTGGESTDSGTGEETDTGETTDTGEETETGGTMGKELLDALDGTIWHGEQTRDGTLRGYELEFDSGALLWAEIRNPFGPARLRELRSFTVDDDAVATHSTVISPQGWPVHPENGRMDDWTLEIMDGSPRVLRTVRDGVTEDFEEGAWPVPAEGLTATVRIFKVGGEVDSAFCDSGANGFEYKTLLDFAHGQSDEIVAQDVVAGAKLDTWVDNTNNNQFSVNDVDGFDQLGGTELSDTFNFFVTYTGTVDHPGGDLAMRELDDSVEDAVWAFLDDKVGSDNFVDLFLEVHGFVWADKTPNEPSATFPAGALPFETILVRCTEQIKSVDVQINFQNAGWELVSDAPTAPEISDDLFPPAL